MKINNMEEGKYRLCTKGIMEDMNNEDYKGWTMLKMEIVEKTEDGRIWRQRI